MITRLVGRTVSAFILIAFFLFGGTTQTYAQDWNYKCPVFAGFQSRQISSGVCKLELDTQTSGEVPVGSKVDYWNETQQRAYEGITSGIAEGITFTFKPRLASDPERPAPPMATAQAAPDNWDTTPASLPVAAPAVTAQPELPPANPHAQLVKDPGEKSRSKCDLKDGAWLCSATGGNVTWTHLGNGASMDYWKGSDPPANADGSCQVTVNGETRTIVCINFGATVKADKITYRPAPGTTAVAAAPQTSPAPAASAPASNLPVLCPTLYDTKLNKVVATTYLQDGVCEYKEDFEGRTPFGFETDYYDPRDGKVHERVPGGTHIVSKGLTVKGKS